VTNHRKRARYVTYEIADQLRPGKNVIGLWLGVSWSIFPPYKTEDRPQTPIVLAQADITLSGGQSKRIVTDGSWRTHPSPNTLLGVWDFMHFGGERYDANLEMPGWCDIDFDDAAWQRAAVYKPNLQVSAEMIEPNRRIQKVLPVGIQEVRPGSIVSISASTSPAGSKRTCADRPVTRCPSFSERAEEDMTHRLRSAYHPRPLGPGHLPQPFQLLHRALGDHRGAARTPGPE
jgi:alpha-L-rhamnosidase